MMHLPIQISEESREPIYHQIEMQLKSLILAGYLQAGDSLPSIRSLAKDLSISVITTRRAYQNLENQGYIQTKQGKGTFVKALNQIKQQETRKNVVRESFQKAIEQGLTLGSSPEELKEVFAEILRQIQEK